MTTRRKAPSKDDLKSKTDWVTEHTDYVYPSELLKAAHYETSKDSYEDRANKKLAEIVGRALSVETDERQAADSALLTGIANEERDRKAADADLQAQIDTNKANIETNRQNIAANKEAIDKNAAAIAQNAADIATNKQAIADEVKARGDADDALQKQIDTNAAEIAENSADIQKNANDITAANTAIQKNADDITAANEAIQKNANDITATNEAVAKNATDIAGANDAISANSSAITETKSKFNKAYFMRASGTTLDDETADDVLQPAYNNAATSLVYAALPLYTNYYWLGLDPSYFGGASTSTGAVVRPKVLTRELTVADKVITTGMKLTTRRTLNVLNTSSAFVHDVYTIAAGTYTLGSSVAVMGNDSDAYLGGTYTSGVCLMTTPARVSVTTDATDVTNPYFYVDFSGANSDNQRNDFRILKRSSGATLSPIGSSWYVHFYTSQSPAQLTFTLASDVTWDAYWFVSTSA